ncbi:hypothetical protein DFH11DRAFT_1640033 [Phellopilus nigrolimitatus]|nr:hypothetical protein DFH11DRAFT_1640033 [Phellopilus nigrolimitatus]
MPSLRKLTIGSTFGPNRSHDFYVSWSLPNLKYLGFTNFIPKPVFRQNLSYCHMKFTLGFQPETLKLFLQSLTSLETLEIEFVDIDDVADGDSDSEEDDDGNNDSVQEDLSSLVSSISSFSFSVVGKTSVPFTRRVLRTIRLNITEMLFTIIYPKCYCPDDYCYEIEGRRENLLKSMRHFPMLKKLHLRFPGPDADHGFGFDFGQILILVPQSLENLQIEARGHTSYIGGWDHTAVRLHTLQFRNCDRLDLDFIGAVRERFLFYNVVIGKVEVVHCRLIEEEDLRDSFPKSEVVWIP